MAKRPSIWRQYLNVTTGKFNFCCAFADLLQLRALTTADGNMLGHNFPLQRRPGCCPCHYSGKRGSSAHAHFHTALTLFRKGQTPEDREGWGRVCYEAGKCWVSEHSNTSDIGHPLSILLVGGTKHSPRERIQEQQRGLHQGDQWPHWGGSSAAGGGQHAIEEAFGGEAGRLHSQVTKASGSCKTTAIMNKEASLLVRKGEAINLHQYWAKMETYMVIIHI